MSYRNLIDKSEFVISLGSEWKYRTAEDKEKDEEEGVNILIFHTPFIFSNDI